jgi:hypothetical protein
LDAEQMNKRVNPQLWETSSNNLVVDVGFTLHEVKELIKVLQPAIAASHKESGTDSGRKTELLSHAMSSLLEANKLLKTAEHER